MAMEAERERMHMNRREFLSSSCALGLTGGSLASAATRVDSRVLCGRDGRAVIFIVLTGGPSQLETFDPKPDAPSDVRGPFRAIETRVPGIRISEHLPRLAKRTDRFSIIRTLHHGDLPVHETGLQLIQTGRLADALGFEFPHVGSVVSHLLSERDRASHWVRMPDVRGLGATGVSMPNGCSAGWLTQARAAAEYDDGAIGTSQVPTPGNVAAWHARVDRTFQQAVDSVGCGTRFVSVDMFSTVFDALSWDMHASSKRLWVSTATYQDVLCPIFDVCFSRLLDSLTDRGLLDETLVVATGEFGRMPRMNSHGGRDHWTNSWSALIAGGGVQGGRVIGATDSIGGEPVERPVTPGELVATIHHSLGIDPQSLLECPDGTQLPLSDGAPIRELF